MLNNITFDTYAFVKHSEVSGLNEEQVEVQVSILTQAIELGVATKIDITELKRDIEELSKETKTAIKEI